MKRIVVFITTLLVVSIFSQNVLTYRKLEKGIEIEGRFISYVLDENGNLFEVYVKQFNRKIKIYEYSNDGFDLTKNGSPLEVKGYEIRGEGKTSLGFEETLTIEYTYTGGVKKSYTFINGPCYLFEVEIEGEADVSLPRVWTPDTDGVSDGIFVSYAPKGKYVSIVEYSGELKGNVLESFSGNLKVYMGPSKKTLIKKAFPDRYDEIMEIFKRLHVYGWYDAIFYGLVWFFYWLYELTGNFGWAIIIFTFVVRLVLYPMYHAQTKSMIKMRKIQKDVEYIKRRYKDPKRQQEELMKLYREKGVNPASGCLLMLVQLPIFFMLWGVIRYFEEEFAFGKPFLIWRDLSVGGFKANIILVLITVVASYFTTLITSQDARTAWQGLIMSIIFPFLFISLPSGLFLYYATNTLIQLAVTYYIYKKYKIKGITTRELFGLPKRG